MIVWFVVASILSGVFTDPFLGTIYQRGFGRSELHTRHDLDWLAYDDFPTAANINHRPAVRHFDVHHGFYSLTVSNGLVQREIVCGDALHEAFDRLQTGFFSLEIVLKHALFGQGRFSGEQTTSKFSQNAFFPRRIALVDAMNVVLNAVFQNPGFLSFREP